MSEDWDSASSAAPDRSTDATVLEIFGISLSVKNPRVAEVLKMDAKEALTRDVRELAGDPKAVRQRHEELHEAVPDIVMTPETVHDVEQTRQRIEFRDRVHGIGRGLEFDVGPDGTWSSPSGVTLVVRAVDKDVSYAAASDFVHKLDVLRESKGGPDGCALFVTATQRTADIFRVAIRQGGFYGSMRTGSVDALSELLSRMSAGEIHHEGVLSILAPIAAVDAGQVVALLGTSHASLD